MIRWLFAALLLGGILGPASHAMDCRGPEGVYQCFSPSSDWEGGPICRQAADCSGTTAINRCCVDTDTGLPCWGNGTICVPMVTTTTVTTTTVVPTTTTTVP